MFRNLEAEQARKGLTNSDVAEKLGISRVSYEGKRKRENSLHLRSRHYVNFSNASLTIFLRQIEKGDEENGKYNRSKQR